MSYSISDKPYDKNGGEISGKDSLDFTLEHHYIAAADKPKGGDPQGAKHEAQNDTTGSDHPNALHARHGASMAVQNGTLKGDSMPFTPSVGLLTEGRQVASCFEQALRDSGGVRQGPSWTSDPAPGAARILVDHSLNLDRLSKSDEGHGLTHQGSSRTFQSQRKANWVKD